jgi:hypothetical protein
MAPRQIRILPGGIPLRELWPGEDKFFRAHPDVSGLAADDDSVVINPYAALTEAQSSAVALNEAARVVMRRPNIRPEFALTDEQRTAFASYGTLEDIRATIAARILSGDPTALTPTVEQIAFVCCLANEMGLSETFARRATEPT